MPPVSQCTYKIHLLKKYYSEDALWNDVISCYNFQFYYFFIFSRQYADLCTENYKKIETIYISFTNMQCASPFIRSRDYRLDEKMVYYNFTNVLF